MQLPVPTGRRRIAPILLTLAFALAACSPGPSGPRPTPTSRPSLAPAATPTAIPSTPPVETPPATSGAASVAPSAPAATPAPTAAATIAPSPTFMTYVVVSGDTLLVIAQRFGTSGRSIAYWNRDRYPSLDPDSSNYRPNHIVIGWRLDLIPGVIRPDDSPGPTVAASPSP